MRTELRLRGLVPSDIPDCELFVKAIASTCFFQSPRYVELISEVTRAENVSVVIVDPKDNFVGYLPLLKKKTEGGWIYNSLPFYGGHGGIVTASAEAYTLLEEHIREIIQNKSTMALTLIGSPFLENCLGKTLPTPHFIDSRIGQFSVVGEFPCGELEDFMGAFHYKTRNAIRKAIKLGVEVNIDNDALNFIEKVHKVNMAKIGGNPKPSSFFEVVRKSLKAGEDYQIFVGRHECKPVAGLLVFYFNDIAEYYTPVVLEEARETQALSYLIAIAMKDAKSKGFKIWNWGGTWGTQDGVYRFKKRWGTTDKNYYYHTWLNNQKILLKSPRDLITEIEYFFVVPFNQLQKSEVTLEN